MFTQNAQRGMGRKKQIGDTPLSELARRIAVKTEAGPNGCLNWTGAKHKAGYGLMRVRGRNVGAHRVSLACTLDKPEMLDKVALRSSSFAKVYVLHSCDNPTCVNPDHLRLGSATDNAEDATARNRRRPYSGSRAAKLGPDAIREIRAVASTWEGLCDMMKKHHVSQITVQSVVDRRSHNHVAD